ncbi:MAG: YbaY family lipoprotein [Gemmatimonadaceae bacterium]
MLRELYAYLTAVSLTGLIAAVMLLAACASAPGPSGTARVTGTVLYRERIALPPDAIVTVQLQDVSRQDVAATVLAEQVIRTEGRQVPFSFALEYDPAAIQSNHRYVVRATIRSGDTLLFTTTQSYPVLGADGLSNAEIVVQRVGA